MRCVPIGIILVVAALAGCGNSEDSLDPTAVAARLEAKLRPKLESGYQMRGVRCVKQAEDRFLCRERVTHQTSETIELPDSELRRLDRAITRSFRRGKGLVLGPPNSRVRCFLYGRCSPPTHKETVQLFYEVTIDKGRLSETRNSGEGSALPYPVPSVLRRHLPPLVRKLAS